jgi:DNA-binding transcriptional ArsR family regulator
MACAVGDELIYFNDEYEDGATPESAGARKHRFDFTHTTKIEPKTRTRSEAELSLYGEYNEQQLSIHLDPIYDAYLVSIIDESDKVVYEKSINAGNIVGLNIDISSYSKGNYAVTVENDYESFNGTFEAQTTGIMDVRKKVEETGDRIYNLQGQRLNSLQKGLNIVNGQKVFVK